MGNRNKDKGKRVEREIATMFTSVLGVPFVRNFDSGAFLGGSNHHRLNNVSESQELLRRGDIIPDDLYKNLVIEVKSRQEFQFHNLCSSVLDIDKWINQLYIDVEQSSQDDLIGLLIFKINRKGSFIVLKDGDFNITDCNYIKYHHKEKNEWFTIVNFDEQFIEKYIKPLATKN